MKKSKGKGHANMKAVKPPQPVQHLRNEVLMNEIALNVGIKLLAKKYPNDLEFGKAVRSALIEGLNVQELREEMEKTGSDES